MVRYNPTGTHFASVGTDKSLCLHHGTTMELLYTLPNLHKATIYTCAWNHTKTNEDSQILTCSADGTVKVTSVNFNDTAHPFKLLHTFSTNTTSVVGPSSSPSTTKTTRLPIGLMQMSCAFLQKNNDIVSVSLNGQISIWDKNNDDDNALSHNGPKLVLSGYQAPIAAMAICNNNMYTGDSNGVLCQWDSSTNKTIGRVQKFSSSKSTNNVDDYMNNVHSGTITSMVLMGDQTLFSVGWDDVIHIICGLQEHAPPIQLPSQPNALAKGTNLIAIMTVDGLLLYYHSNNISNNTDQNNNKNLSEFISLDYQPSSICLSKNDRTLYVGDSNGSIHIYSVTDENHSTVQLQYTMQKAHRNSPVYAMQLSNDNTKLASADIRDVCVWNIINDDDDTTSYLPPSPIIEPSKWCFHTQRIQCLAWSADDTILATAGNDDSIYIWSLHKQTRRVHYPFSHRGGISGLQFLSNYILQSVGADACVNQWDVTDAIQKNSSNYTNNETTQSN
mmetsp:Transcript_12954/g.12585  ORF Transcript_12954/g.12585 Transcript_12954/m.12585 type:complete len:502 (-) Transcript_12954:182-1687(-)